MNQMNSFYAGPVQKQTRLGLIILSVSLCLLGGVLAAQSVKFASSLWILLQFGYGEWGEYLVRMLRYLAIWAIVGGAIFSIQFFLHAPSENVKKLLSGVIVGFITGFAFTYLLVLEIGIAIYLPLGIASLLIPDIIRFATLEFAWLLSAYVVFIFIALDTPRLIVLVIKEGNWYSKMLAVLFALLLANQVLLAIMNGLEIIVHNSIWRTRIEAFVIAIGVSLFAAIIMNFILLRGVALIKVVFAVIIVYVASITTGNVSAGVFHWDELTTAVIAGFIGPIAYSLVAKIIVAYEMTAIFSIAGIGGGTAMGLFFAQFTRLRIIGQGWSGMLCGTMIVFAIAAGFGVIFGGTITDLMVRKMNIKPVIAFWTGAATSLGIIVGTILGGLLAR